MRLSAIFGVSHAANLALRERRAAQNRVARETRRPLGSEVKLSRAQAEGDVTVT